MDATLIDLLILDVDGVLTDGRVTPSPDGDAPARFHTQDGCALKLWRRCGGEVAILTGRGCRNLEQRAAELGIKHLHRGCGDKVAAYRKILSATRRSSGTVGYIGDDLPDLGPMAQCAFPVAVRNAVPAVKRVAEYVTRRAGGFGAVAEVVELLLRQQGRWSQAVAGGA